MIVTGRGKFIEGFDDYKLILTVWADACYLHNAMGQVLRITHNGMDYSFVILNKEPLSRETREIMVSVNGETKTLVQRDRSWLPAEEAGDAEIAMAIGKTIALRYRI